MAAPRSYIAAAGALVMAAAVVAGAFGAHGLKNSLSIEDLAVWDTAVRYQLVHGLGLMLLGQQMRTPVTLPAMLMLFGTLIFSGSLFVLVLSDIRWIGAITPIGGALLIGSWLLVAWRHMRQVS